jgi:GH15 family glucan-1,4-alpha-glucosidase
MCWAGIHCAIRIQEKGYLKNLSGLTTAKQKAEDAIMHAVVSGVLRNGPNDQGLDSSLLHLPLMHYPNQKLNEDTVNAIYENLKTSSNPQHRAFLYRYNRPDDFGTPHSAFMICSFWLVQAMANIGQKKRGLELLEQCQSAGNHLGLYAEHLKPETGTQLGNFPQAYSHVGLINAAFAVSPSWQEAV